MSESDEVMKKLKSHFDISKSEFWAWKAYVEAVSGICMEEIFVIGRPEGLIFLRYSVWLLSWGNKP